MDQVEHRVGNLERRADTTDQRLDEHGRRLDKYDDNMQRVWERLDTHRDVQIKTQTLVEVGNQQTADLRTSFEAFKQSQEKRRLEDENATKARAPKWAQVVVTGGALLISLISLIVVLLSGGGHL